MSLARFVALVGFVAWLSVAAACPADEIVLFDFERRGLGEQWSAVGKITAARVPVAGEIPEGEIAPAGQMLALTSEGAGGIYAREGTLPGDWRTFREVRFWMRRAGEPAADAKPAALELQLLEADGRTRFWRKIEVAHGGWRQYRVPLKWMRWGDGRIPRWDRIERLGFWFRDAADLHLDAVSVITGESPAETELTADDLRRLAFPDLPRDEVRIAERGPVLLLTNAGELRTEELAAHLGQVWAAVFAELDFLPKPPRAVPLIVFASRGQYRAFPPRLAALMNSQAPPPPSDGFTLQAISTSYYDEKRGTLRPVYTHEFVHAVLTPSLELQNKGEWLHEGLAVCFQMRFHPQADLVQIVRGGMADPSAHLPLEQLCHGGPIPSSRYWQAMTVVEMLLKDEELRKRLPGLIEAFRAAGSTDLGPQLMPVLQSDWESMTARWRRFCEQTYRAENRRGE